VNKKTKSQDSSGLIADNRKARHDYPIEDHYEAGLVLAGWEVKSIRAGRVQLKDSYVILSNGEAWLLNSHISPLQNVPEYIKAEPERTRKLLLNQRELGRLISAKSREGYTIVPLNMHWRKNRIKLEIAIAKGKKQYDKRESEKEKSFQREKARKFKGA
jgi:SsrA-binding protein